MDRELTTQVDRAEAARQACGSQSCQLVSQARDQRSLPEVHLKGAVIIMISSRVFRIKDVIGAHEHTRESQEGPVPRLQMLRIEHSF